MAKRPHNKRPRLTTAQRLEVNMYEKYFESARIEGALTKRQSTRLKNLRESEMGARYEMFKKDLNNLDYGDRPNSTVGFLGSNDYYKINSYKKFKEMYENDRLFREGTVELTRNNIKALIGLYYED